MKKLILAALVAICSLNVNAATIMSDPSKSIQVEKANPRFTITLESNQTTGYSWLLKRYNHNLLKLVKHTYQAPDQSVPGAGGYESWIFEVKEEGFRAPQIAKIKLLYARPWNLSDNSKPIEFTIVTH